MCFERLQVKGGRKLSICLVFESSNQLYCKLVRVVFASKAQWRNSVSVMFLAKAGRKEVRELS